jgi:hypothetical protein
VLDCLYAGGALRASDDGAPSHAKGGAGELRLRPMAWTTVTYGQHHRIFRNTMYQDHSNNKKSS